MSSFPKKIWIVLLVVAAATMAGVLMKNKSASKHDVIRVGLPGSWNTIHPGLQHTLYADLLLSNQFEALVGVNEKGVSLPLGALNWEVSDDFKFIRFKIDTNRTFSDGSKLTAADYKRSWETAARLEPISANSSLLDFLYKIEGYDKLSSKGDISGIRAVNDEILEVTFSTPFRTALEFLQGNRLAAYKEKDGIFIGTGPYIFEELDSNHVLMHPRNEQRYAHLPSLDVKFIPDSVPERLLSGEVDVIHYLSGHLPRLELLDRADIGILPGTDAIHIVLGLNYKAGSIFSDRNFRKAFQYLVREAIKQDRSLLPREPLFQPDFQHFLPFQAGRLDENDVVSIIDEGRSGVAGLIEASKRKPILVKSSVSTQKFIDLVHATGLELAEESGSLPAKQYVDLTYAKEGPDLIVLGFSVASGDPDGIYHVLGANGSIRTPYVFSEAASNLLEQGRKLEQIANLDSHYKKVSRALLEEAPNVHLGFAKAVTAYRIDRVEIDATVLRRNQGQLHFLRAKQ